MKIIFRIIIILTVAALVAGALSLAVGGGTNSGQFSRGFEGGEGRAGSLGAGLLGMAVSLLQLAAIVGLVLSSKNGIKFLKSQQVEPKRTA